MPRPFCPALAAAAFPEWFLPRASNHAAAVDGLFFGLCALSAFMCLVVSGAILYFGVKYYHGTRAVRSDKEIHATGIEVAWTVLPAFLFLGLFGWAAWQFFLIETPPPDCADVYVVGKQYMWKVQHPSGRTEINELHVPLGQPTRLVLASEDVIHDFSVPAFRTKQDAVPGKYTNEWFVPTKLGTYRLFCTQYCGVDHSRMGGLVYVMSPADYQNWLRAGSDGNDMIGRGHQKFTALGCSGCHGANNNASVRAPSLDGLYNRLVQTADGRVVKADEQYLRESILQPNKQVVAGYPAIMPTYEGQLQEEEIIELIAYIKSLSEPQNVVKPFAPKS